MKQLKHRSMVERILAIVEGLHNERGIKTTELVEQLEVSPKTIHRDIDFIRDRLMVDLECKQGLGHDWRYTAQNTRQLPPIVKTLASIV